MPALPGYNCPFCGQDFYRTTTTKGDPWQLKRRALADHLDGPCEANPRHTGLL